MNERLRKAEEDIAIFHRVGDRSGSDRENFDITMVESSVPTGENTEALLKAISTFVNTNVHLRANQIAKQTVTKLALGARANHKIVNEMIRDLDGLKQEKERFKFQVKNLERQLQISKSKIEEKKWNNTGEHVNTKSNRSKTPIATAAKFDQSLKKQANQEKSLNVMK